MFILPSFLWRDFSTGSEMIHIQRSLVLCEQSEGNNIVRLDLTKSGNPEIVFPSNGTGRYLGYYDGGAGVGIAYLWEAENPPVSYDVYCFSLGRNDLGEQGYRGETLRLFE
ncbi:hypothetical protein RRG08_019073 [Elysia crispata]|uniref:Uncharacterized protein n=1 Tax=Elysia crispata TaxID=231223 RepID=A0AAE1A528_9GAST|nr:hypothetical protein RRG08_019073 [Elysia crispata]